MNSDEGGTRPGSAGGNPASLGFVVSGEVHRVLSAEQIEADPARIAAGWVRRFIANGPRAEEMVDLYRELGFEVVADPILPQQTSGDCSDCQLLIQLQFKMIYTRKVVR